MNFPFLISAFAVLLFAIGLGEVAWIGIVIVMAFRFAARSKGLPRKAVMLVLAGSIIFFHLRGFKFYGNPVTYDNRPLLASSHVLSALEPAATVLCTDGTRLQLRNTVLTAWATRLPQETLQSVFERRSNEPVYVAESGKGSGVVAQLRIHYWCGNTWYPAFFPERLPTHRLQDFGAVLEYNDMSVTAIQMLKLYSSSH